jgi:hypothetical protein
MSASDIVRNKIGMAHNDGQSGERPTSLQALDRFRLAHAPASELRGRATRQQG